MCRRQAEDLLFQKSRKEHLQSVAEDWDIRRRPLQCPPWKHLPRSYLVGGPSLLVGPVPVAAQVPPLDLQRVGWGAAASEGAGHLHILACPRCHVMGCLCEKCCSGNRQMRAQKQEPTPRVAVCARRCARARGDMGRGVMEEG